MAKPKYSPETKLAVVNHYLSGKDGEQSTADLFGIERTSVRRWVRAWQFHGAEGLTAKNNHLKQNWLWLIIICPVKTENRVQPTFLVLKEHLSVAGSGHGSSTVQKA
ncbi:helix-turn-helix domain-containing protein [Klebsiella pneumoniae]|uniref:helix-turn-helix domain-containing protein n=1 Tax=Klebsiella pneumoniae TaxID=573 RepID=UPI00287B97E3|nr:helix-turn-helix domain-containing protein [Klebsiella pneumoniae]